MKALKKSIIVCGLSLVLCVGLLMGTTFAWFTDTVTNSGNIIQAGTLELKAYAYDTVDAAAEGTTSVTVDDLGTYIFEPKSEAQDLDEDNSPIIGSALAEPGATGEPVLLELENAGSLPLQFKLEFIVDAGGLEGALWFDFIGVDASGNVSGQYTQRRMDQLNTVAGQLENTSASYLDSNESVRYMFVYGMYGTAGNEYQGETFSVSVVVSAKQTVDGAEYETYTTVANSAALTEQVREGGYILLTDDMALDLTSDEGSSAVTKDTTINLNGKTLTNEMAYTLVAAEGATLTIENGTLDFSEYIEGKNLATSDMGIREGATLVLRNCTITSVQAVACIGSEDPSVDSENSKLIVENCTINTTNSTAISTNAKTNYYCEIEIRNTDIYCGPIDGVPVYSGLSRATDNCPVFMNVKGKLTMDNCKITGQRQGVMVRSGTAIISDTSIVLMGTYTGSENGDDNDKYWNAAWGGGNNVPMAALVVGDYSSSYPNNADVTLNNCMIESKNATLPAVYIWGDGGYSATLTYDSTTQIVGTIGIRGGVSNDGTNLVNNGTTSKQIEDVITGPTTPNPLN